MTLGLRIYNLRKQKGLTQKQLSELVGVSRQTIHKWENDFIQPSIDNLKSLSKIFGVNSVELLSLVYPVDINNETEALSLSYENGHEEILEEAIVNIKDDKGKQVNGMTKSSRHIDKLTISLAVILVLIILITAWMWFVVGSRPEGDAVNSNYYIDDDALIIMIIVSTILTIIESVLIVLTIKNKRRKNDNKNNIYLN